MKIHTSGEDYLKAIYILRKENGTARSLDVAERIGVSKPSVSHAVKLLREGGFLVMNGRLYPASDRFGAGSRRKTL